MGSEKNCDFRNKSNVSAVVCGKHAPLFRERKVVSRYWPALLEHFPSARPHPVPMVPSALIGYCNFWSERGLVSSFIAIGPDHLPIKWNNPLRNASKFVLSHP